MSRCGASRRGHGKAKFGAVVGGSLTPLLHLRHRTPPAEPARPLEPPEGRCRAAGNHTSARRPGRTASGALRSKAKTMFPSWRAPFGAQGMAATSRRLPCSARVRGCGEAAQWQRSCGLASRAAPFAAQPRAWCPAGVALVHGLLAFKLHTQGQSGLVSRVGVGPRSSGAARRQRRPPVQSRCRIGLSCARRARRPVVPPHSSRA